MKVPTIANAAFAVAVISLSAVGAQAQQTGARIPIPSGNNNTGNFIPGTGLGNTIPTPGLGGFGSAFGSSIGPAFGFGMNPAFNFGLGAFSGYGLGSPFYGGYGGFGAYGGYGGYGADGGYGGPTITVGPNGNVQPLGNGNNGAGGYGYGPGSDWEMLRAIYAQGYQDALNKNENNNQNGDASDTGRATDQNVAAPARVPHGEDTVKAWRVGRNQLALRWQGDPRTASSVTFELTDSAGRALRRTTVSQLPAEVRFTPPAGAAFYQVIVHYVDGQTNTIMSKLGK